ncbi:uncharacterized protein LOC117594840 isoform X2 [Esox lucius]|uniref:uncharacterized protein LOC117594840 isoform X2 n=1 Tax=Esox lucius TaxID=8010 RepID=UPI001476F9F2|nr:uncharacterized protein LOC117594840 isoform X2 [Esox lucius]
MRTTESVLVVVIWSLSGTMAIKCGQTSQVRVSPITPVWGQKVILTCNTPCNLTDNQNPTYIWYKNGQRLLNSTIWTFNDTSYYTHSYSCAVNGSENLRSPVVCVLGKTCFNVTYTHQRISALKGSTLDLPCTYQHPNNHTVIEMYWYVQQKRDVVPTNLSSLPEYSGRVKYLGDNMSDCTLRITDLRETDSAEYKFRFKTQFADKKIAEWGYSFPGTTLTVSGRSPPPITQLTQRTIDRGTLLLFMTTPPCPWPLMQSRQWPQTTRLTSTTPVFTSLAPETRWCPCTPPPNSLHPKPRKRTSSIRL